MNSNLKNKFFRRLVPWMAVVIVVALGVIRCRRPSAAGRIQTHVITRGEFTVWSMFEGSVQAERRAPMYSKISQPSAVLFLAPEGSLVETGDLVAELDRSSLDQTLAGLERDYTLAKSELQTLLRADIPGELTSAENELATLRYDEQKQRRIVENTGRLRAEGLVSASEEESQQMLLTNLTMKVAFQESRLASMRDVTHPAREAKIRAQIEATERQLHVVREQVEGARMTAPISGMVVHLPVHIDGEFRNVREGDTLFRSQKITQIADMSSLLVHCQVPESSVSLVTPGNPALISPIAFPGLQLGGRVESVGSVAVSVAGKPAWQKFFNVVIRLDETDERLRSSMTVTVQILSQAEAQALLVPRAMVGWERGQPWCIVRASGRAGRRTLELGPGNETHFVVRTGLDEGDVVQTPDPTP